MSERYTFTSTANARYYFLGQPIYVVRSGRRFVRLRGAPLWLHRIWCRLTRPFRRRVTVTAIDPETGTITVADDPAWWRFL